MSRQVKDVDARTAISGTWAGLTDAAWYSGAGMRSAGRRVGRRTRHVAARSGGRGAMVVHALRGDLRRRSRRRVARLAVAGVLAGAAGAATALGTQLLMARRQGARGWDDAAPPTLPGADRKAGDITLAGV
jgi:hypothetical protein